MEDSPFLPSHHYSLAMKPDQLVTWAELSAMKVHWLVGSNLPLFCYSGMSGVSAATALSMKYYQQYGSNFGMIYIRKLGESTYGRVIEQSLNKLVEKNVQLVFIDDMVSFGRTRRRVVQETVKYCQENEKFKLLDPLIQCLKHDTIPYSTSIFKFEDC